MILSLSINLMVQMHFTFNLIYLEWLLFDSMKYFWTNMYTDIFFFFPLYVSQEPETRTSYSFLPGKHYFIKRAIIYQPNPVCAPSSGPCYFEHSESHWPTLWT